MKLGRFKPLRTALLALLAWLMAGPAIAETRALLVGVSRYASPAIPDLAGPANDLAAMNALVRKMGASDVIILGDRSVSRSSVETALHEIGLRAKPGDWILFYYSGHGAQAIAPPGRTAADGAYDQFLPLPGFDPDNQDSEHFIVDKDFYSWMKRYAPSDVRILMIIDSCHSGSMHRAVDPRAFAYTSRLALRPGEQRALELVARPGPRLPALRLEDANTLVAADRDTLPNLIYLGASRDDQLALETALPQEGDPQRGVLTFAFEQGLTTPGSDGASLAADLNSDGIVTVIEVSSYLNSQVRMLSAQRQESSAFFPSGWTDLPLFSALPAPQPLIENPPPAVAFAPPPTGPLPTNAPWRLVEKPDNADFFWLTAEREVVRRSGDVVATGVINVTAFNGVIEKWRTVMALRPLVSELNMQMRVDPSGSDVIYTRDTKIAINLASQSRGNALTVRYATVFNLASDGTVQLLYPLAGDGEGALPASGVLTVIETSVVPPFGTDHIVAVATADDAAELRAALRMFDGQRGPARLIGLIRAGLKRAKGAGSLSIAEVYTGR